MKKLAITLVLLVSAAACTPSALPSANQNRTQSAQRPAVHTMDNGGGPIGGLAAPASPTPTPSATPAIAPNDNGGGPIGGSGGPVGG